MTIFGFAKYLAKRLIEQPSATGGPKPYASNAGNIFFALFAAVGMVGAVGYGFNSVLRGPIASMTETTRRTVAESTVITSSRLAIVGATTQQAGAGDTDDDGFIEPVPYRDAGTGPHPAGGGYLPTALNIPNTIDPWNTEYGYCAWDHGSITASSRRLVGSPNNNRFAIAIISAGKDKRFQTGCLAYVDDTTELIQRTAGSDDIVLAYTYAEANNLGNGLWKPHATEPNTATTDRNIDVGGGGVVSGGVVLSGNTATGGGLILPSDPGDDSISGPCNAANDNQLRYNVGDPAEAPVIEICDNGGLGWSPISGGAGGGGGGTTGQLVAHYTFDESTGTTASDETGSHDGTLTNGPTWLPGQGRISGAISLDGNNDHVVVANTAALRPSAVTIAAWINLPSTQVNNNAKILTKEWQGHGGPIYTTWAWSISAGPVLTFETGHTDNTPHLYVGADIAANQWVHVVTLFDPAQTPPKRVYVNGVLVDSDNDATPLAYDTATDGDGDLIIGQSSGGSESVAAKIDDLRIYNYGMTDEEVTALYSSVNPSSLNLDAPMKAGAVYSWGGDGDGRLGNGTAETTPRHSPGPLETTSDYIDVSAGQRHGCGIKADGTAWCWGWASPGSLGNGTTTPDQAVPVQVSGLSNAIKISAGSHHTCALRNDGAVLCWGSNADGRLGDGTTTRRLTPVQVVGIANAIDIAAGVNRSCAVVADGRAWCWGFGDNGELGNGSAATSHVPVQVADVTDFVQISMGVGGVNDPTCAVTRRGKAYCWGSDSDQQLGNGPGTTFADRPSEVTNTMDNFSKVSVSSLTACAIVASGNNRVACWGRGNYGKIGHGSAPASVDTPTLVSNISGIVDIAVSTRNACAVEATGNVWCWGDDMALYGGLGNGEATSTQSNIPVLAKVSNAYKISGGLDFLLILVDTSVQASAAPPPYTKKYVGAEHHACHIRGDGTMWCWGTEEYGELGNGGGLTDTAESPVRVTDPGPWMSVSTDRDHTCGIKVDGSLWCWGRDHQGQLGNGATAGSQASPSPVTSTIPWVQVSAGNSMTCGIKADGTGYCWGDDGGGKLGNGGGGSTNAPGSALISATATWLQISAGYASCGIRTDNSLWCWGNSDGGHLPNGTMAPNLQAPVQMGSDKWRYVEISAPCGIKVDGSLWCWGDNSNGRLGAGTTYTGTQTVPRLVVEPGPWASVSPGHFNNNCAVKMDGTGWCWGGGTDSLGLGYYPGSDLPYPVQVVGKDWIHIDGKTTIAHCGLKNDDSLWCWGQDFAGTLGNGPGNNSSNYPRRIYQPYKMPFTSAAATYMTASSTTYASSPAANLAIGTVPLTNAEGVVQGLSFPGGGRSVLSQATTANQLTLETASEGGAAQVWLNANSRPYYMGYNAYTGGMEFGYGGDWLLAYTAAALEVSNLGFTGIGTGGAPVARLDVRGAIKMGDAGGTCNGGLAGTLKYAGGIHTYCNGSAWVPFGDVVVENLVWDTAPTAGGTSENHRCAIKSNGTLWCGGEEFNGELGNGGSGSENTGLNSVQVGTHTWKQASNTCAIRSDGTAWCWGEGTGGELGNNAWSNSNVPVQVVNDSGGAGWSDWISIAAGYGVGFGIRSDGSAWWWGGSASNRPTRVPDTSGSGYWTDWKQISAGAWNQCGIRSDGSAWCWGVDANLGICGNGTWGPWCAEPTQVRNTANTGAWYDWVTISASEGTACGIRANGEAYCWGTDYYSGNGYLGHGSTTPSNTPQKVHDTVGSTGFNDWVSIETGTVNTCGIRATGQVYCWGNLGYATYLRPFLMSPDSDWIGVYRRSDKMYPCFTRAGGRMFCLFWGDSTLTEILP